MPTLSTGNTDKFYLNAGQKLTVSTDAGGAALITRFVPGGYLIDSKSLGQNGSQDFGEYFVNIQFQIDCLQSVTSYQISQSTATISGTGGSLSDFSDSKITTTPNATVPIVVLKATGDETDIDVALLPKGVGALTARIADNTDVGGNKRGQFATDWQSSSASGDATAIASGYASCIPGGEGNKASGYAAFAAGEYSIASGDDSTAFATGIASGDHSFAHGLTNTASGRDSVVIGGRGADTRGIIGARAMSSGTFNNVVGQQFAEYSPQAKTTNATATRMIIGVQNSLGAPNAANQITLLPNSAISFIGQLIAFQPTTGDSKAWKFEGAIKQGANAAGTALVAAVTPSVIAADSGASAWSLAVSADTTIGCLALTVTGEASKTLQWVCKVDTVETVMA